MSSHDVYQIQGREVTLPCIVRDASSGNAMYMVPAEAAQKLIPGDAFEVMEVAPGQAQLILGIIDYRDNDLGDYNEMAIIFLVKPKGAEADAAGTFIYKLPVDQAFTCEAGSTIWGFPKTVQQIDMEYRTDRASLKLVYDGVHALTLSLPRGGSKSLPESTLTGFTSIEGVAHTNEFRSGAEGFGVRLGGAELSLGEGLIADQLRSLGLPKKALMTTWMEKMYATFGPSEKL